MKLQALQQSYAGGRSNNNFRSSSSTASSVPSESPQPSTIFWLLLHGLSCLVSLVLGFRFSRAVFYLLLSSAPTNPAPFADNIAVRVFNLPAANQTAAGKAVAATASVGSSVVVGRQGIRIRPWPHPDPDEVMKAHRILERVQWEQRAQYGFKVVKTLIAVTPTYVRTFQALHLTGVMHSLMNAPYDVVWIVIEAGGSTNETGRILAKSGLRVIHIGFDRHMPVTWEDRHKMEAQMRFHALRVVRDEKLDGIVLFADDSNMHSLEFFDEIQKVNWFGAVSVGFVAHSATVDQTPSSSSAAVEKEYSELKTVQGPVCNSSDRLVGWHTFDSLTHPGKKTRYIDERALEVPQKLEWAGFVLNSRLLWKDGDHDKPEWANDLDSLGNVESPLCLLKDHSLVEPLGSCGRKVLLWWLRVEARSDSKFPTGWTINHPLEITVPAKWTPWPDAPPEVSANENEINTQEHVQIRTNMRTQSSQLKRSLRGKRKHGARAADMHESKMNSEEK